MGETVQNTRKQITLYIAATLMISWALSLLTGSGDGGERNIILIIMFIPGIMALIFQVIFPVSLKKVVKDSFKHVNLKSMIFALLYPLVFVSICALLSTAVGIGKLDMPKILNPNRFVNFLINSVLTILPVIGEEYGWRGFLLPRLTSIMGRVKASALLGIIWALYHIPVIYIMAGTNGIPYPVAAALLQGLSLFVLSFAFSYCYYISDSFIPVVIIHAFWNGVNTWILGDIFSNKTAMVKGNLFLINAEGLAGLLLGTLFMIAFIIKLKNTTIEDKAARDGFGL